MALGRLVAGRGRTTGADPTLELIQFSGLVVLYQGYRVLMLGTGCKGATWVGRYPFKFHLLIVRGSLGQNWVLSRHFKTI